jgi:gamma-glutamylcyclotransferase (GGCT)/AIG2-like uncharacterized protein YtfP
MTEEETKIFKNLMAYPRTTEAQKEIVTEIYEINKKIIEIRERII